MIRQITLIILLRTNFAILFGMEDAIAQYNQAVQLFDISIKTQTESSTINAGWSLEGLTEKIALLERMNSEFDDDMKLLQDLCAQRACNPVLPKKLTNQFYDRWSQIYSQSYFLYSKLSKFSEEYYENSW